MLKLLLLFVVVVASAVGCVDQTAYERESACADGGLDGGKQDYFTNPTRGCNKLDGGG